MRVLIYIVTVRFVKYGLTQQVIIGILMAYSLS